MFLFANIYQKGTHEGFSEKRDNETKDFGLAGLSNILNIILSLPSAPLGVQWKRREIYSCYSAVC